MKMKSTIITIGVAVAVMFSARDAFAPPAPGGTSTTQFTSDTDMANTGVEPNARGKIHVTINLQGDANKQQRKIELS